jgi:hypothetical protein
MHSEILKLIIVILMTSIVLIMGYLTISLFQYKNPTIYVQTPFITASPQSAGPLF